MNIRKIVEEYLGRHGFDGLYYPGMCENCGCEKSDLFPCGYGPGEVNDCAPGYKQQPSEDWKEEFGDDCEWMIGPDKPGGGGTG